MAMPTRLLKILFLFTPLVLFACHQTQHAEATDKQKETVANQPEQVVIYTAEWCWPCKTLMRSLDAKGVAYTDYDVDLNEKAQQEFIELGARGLPTTVVGGKQVILGDDPEGVIAALKALNQQ